ncbi:MAG: pyridoxal phosphate-dependent aminotransferase [Myxococcales bacterium]
MKLANRLASVKPSPTLTLNAKARALAAKGADVVSFAAGEPDFDTPLHIKVAAKNALDEGFTKYTPTGGIPELKAAIIEKLRRDNHLEYAPEQILAAVGAKHAIFNVFQAHLSPGDEVIIFAPYWVSYPDMVRLADGVPIIVQTDSEAGWVPNPDDVRRALTPRTRAVIINSPSNPSGAVIPPKALEGIAEAVRDHDCLLISDDIYERLLYVPEGFQNIANVAPDLVSRTVVINGFSKAFAMTGWRLGYAAGPKELIAGMQTIQDQQTSNPTSFVQKAALAALKGPQEPVEAMVAEFKKRREMMVTGLNRIPGVKCPTPQGAFYCFVDVKGLIGRSYKGQPVSDSMRVSEILLEDYLVAAVPGAPFGAEGFIRFSFATSPAKIEKGISRIAEFASQLT